MQGSYLTVLKESGKAPKHWEHIVHTLLTMLRNTVKYPHRSVHWYKITDVTTFSYLGDTKSYKFYKNPYIKLTYVILHSSLDKDEWEELKYKLKVNL